MNMQIQETTENKLAAAQTAVFESGNEMAAMAAAQINYHMMGYFRSHLLRKLLNILT